MNEEFQNYIVFFQSPLIYSRYKFFVKSMVWKYFLLPCSLNPFILFIGSFIEQNCFCHNAGLEAGPCMLLASALLLSSIPSWRWLFWVCCWQLNQESWTWQTCSCQADCMAEGSSVVQYLPSMCRTLDSIPSTMKKEVLICGPVCQLLLLHMVLFVSREQSSLNAESWRFYFFLKVLYFYTLHLSM